ncbi:MAG: sigma-70 family RNA polymerase sigma factor [Hydrogenobaculum sp.]
MSTNINKDFDVEKKEQREKRILEYIPLVKKICGKISRNLSPSVDYNDLVSNGIIGLINAIGHLDESKNPESYIKIRAKGAIYDYLRSLDFGSRNIRDKEHKIKEIIRNFQNEHQREPTDEEISSILGESLKEYQNSLYKISFSYLQSLEDIVYKITEENESSYDNFVISSIETPEEYAIKSDLAEKLKEAVDKLEEREKRLVLQLLFYEELGIKEVAEILNVSLSRISQIKSQALEKLRKHLEETI